MHIVPTHTTVGEAILQAELFQHAVVRSLLLLGGAQAAQVQLFGGGGGGGAGASAWSRASEAMRLQSASAFRSPVLSFRYFAQRERGIEVRRDVAVDRSGGGGGAGAGAGATTTTTATEATPRVLQISAAGGADSDNAQFGDCVVLVIGAATRDTHEATSTSSHAAASGLHAPVAPVPLAGARPMSAPVGARGGNLHRRGPHGAAAAGVRSVTVQAVLARVPLSAFRGAAAANNDESAGDSGDDDDRHAASGVFRGAFSASSPAPVPAGPSEVVSTYSVFVDLTTKCINVTCTSAQQQQQMQQRHRQMQQQQQQQQTAAMRRIIDAMTARSAGKEPAPTTVAVSFDEQLESPPVRAALIANDAAMFIGVMITSPCGAVEIVNLEDVGGEEES